MKKMFLFSFFLLILSIFTIPISILIDSEILLVIGILLPIIIGTFSMIIFWEYTMQFPKKPINIQQIQHNVLRLLEEPSFKLKANEAKKIFQYSKTLDTIYSIVHQDLTGHK